MAAFASTDDLGDLLGETLTGARLAQATAILDLATAQIQGWTRQRLERVVDDTIVLPGGTGWELELPERPVVEATVTAIDGVVPVVGSYRLVGTTLIRPGGWAGPGLYSANWPAWTGYYPPVVEVTYTHGFDPIPDNIRMACLQVAARMLQNPSGIRQEQIGSYSVTYSGDNTGELLTGSETDLLGRYRRRAESVRIK